MKGAISKSVVSVYTEITIFRDFIIVCGFFVIKFKKVSYFLRGKAKKNGLIEEPVCGAMSVKMFVMRWEIGSVCVC